MFGVFEHEVLRTEHEIVRGFDEIFYTPHSRHTEIRQSDIDNVSELEILVQSEIAGVHLAASKNIPEFFCELTGKYKSQFFITGHSEYDFDTLAGEYFRDKNKGLEIAVPVNYFPDDDDTKTPKNTWRGHAHLLFSNWLNYFVYQATPFDIDLI
jgi:homoserine O-succinyltransferase